MALPVPKQIAVGALDILFRAPFVTLPRLCSTLSDCARWACRGRSLRPRYFTLECSGPPLCVYKPLIPVTEKVLWGSYDLRLILTLAHQA